MGRKLPTLRKEGASESISVRHVVGRKLPTLRKEGASESISVRHVVGRKLPTLRKEGVSESISVRHVVGGKLPTLCKEGASESIPVRTSWVENYPHSAKRERLRVFLLVRRGWITTHSAQRGSVREYFCEYVVGKKLPTARKEGAFECISVSMFGIFLKLVARGFLRVLRFPPLLRRLMVQPIK